MERDMTAKVRWALIGASTIADEWMVDALRSQPDGEIATVVSGNAERAREFAEKSTPSRDTRRTSTQYWRTRASPRSTSAAPTRNICRKWSRQRKPANTFCVKNPSR
jgi:hypothetical protein